jgi:hypothetical protein
LAFLQNSAFMPSPSTTLQETNMSKPTNKTLETLLTQIALDHLFIETLETRHSDRLDFHEVSVWAVKSALMAAYEAGRQAAKQD